MKNQKDHLSIWLIFNLVRIGFWVNIFFAIEFTVKTILFLLGLLQNFHPEHYIPCKFEVLEKGALALSNSSLLVGITEATGRLHFDKLPSNLLVLISLAILPLYGASILPLWFFKKFITNVKQGQAFKVDNIQYLKKIAYVLLVGWVYSKIIMIISNLIIMNTVVFESVKIQFTPEPPILLYFALFIWVLSHVFQKGAGIEEENSLTI